MLFSRAHFQRQLIVLLYLLKQAAEQYNELCQEASSESNFYLLCMLRSPVWEYIKTKCPSFVSMDCNAQFIEIFTEEVFSDLSAHEKNIISNYIQHAFCNFCQQHISTNTSVFINYISLREVLCVGLSPLNWPEFIMQGNTTTKILCSTRNQNCCVQTSGTKMSNILFVEFSPGMTRFHCFINILLFLGIILI